MKPLARSLNQPQFEFFSLLLETEDGVCSPVFSLSRVNTSILPSYSIEVRLFSWRKTVTCTKTLDLLALIPSVEAAWLG
jgi:hypothetical protein